MLSFSPRDMAVNALRRSRAADNAGPQYHFGMFVCRTNTMLPLVRAVCISLLAVLASCSSGGGDAGAINQAGVAGNPGPADDTVAQQVPESLPVAGMLAWAESAIGDYLQNGTRDIQLLARKQGVTPSWILDRYEETDSATYLIAHLGHNVAEPDGSDPRFVTDGWLYLDTVRKRIYEYDLPNDSLVFWK